MSVSSKISSRSIIGWAVAIVFVFAMTGYHLKMDYTGLKSPVGMDQAQIAREMARGNGMTTKNVRPLLLSDRARHAEEAGKAVDMENFKDTYHSPLNPLINSVMFKISGANYSLEEQGEPLSSYAPDRLITALSMVFLLGAIAVTYLLVSRIFDRKIGAVVAVLMIFCDLMWEFSKTGMPQMLMLFLFIVAMLFLYKATENGELVLPTMPWLVLSAIFFGLLALSHWITVWIFFGVVVYVLFVFRPRGVAVLVMSITFLAVISPALYHNYQVTGQIGGDARYVIYEGLSGAEGGGLMNSFNIEQVRLKGLAGRVVVESIGQLNNVVALMGAIFAAPLFFIALLHPFKRPEIAKFRWGILLMWIFAVVGMTLYGLPGRELSSNQMHIIFAPIMAGYGLAILAVLWSRLAIPSDLPVLRHGHLIIVVLLSALPILLGIFQTLSNPYWGKSRPQYPYLPGYLIYLNEWVDDDEIIVSDMSEGVAWYADRDAIAIPSRLGDFNEIEELAKASGMSIAGIHISPLSVNLPYIDGTRRKYRDWAPLVTLPQRGFIDQNQSSVKLNNFAYNTFNRMYSDMYFWSNRVRSNEQMNQDRNQIQQLELPKTEEEGEDLEDFGNGSQEETD